jgi:hypothetical protein
MRSKLDVPTAETLRGLMGFRTVMRILEKLKQLTHEGKYPSMNIEPEVMSDYVIKELERLGYTVTHNKASRVNMENYTISI